MSLKFLPKADTCHLLGHCCQYLVTFVIVVISQQLECDTHFHSFIVPLAVLFVDLVHSILLFALRLSRPSCNLVVFDCFWNIKLTYLLTMWFLCVVVVRNASKVLSTAGVHFQVCMLHCILSFFTGPTVNVNSISAVVYSAIQGRVPVSSPTVQ